jgi:hypothetical protein
LIVFLKQRQLFVPDLPSMSVTAILRQLRILLGGIGVSGEQS